MNVRVRIEGAYENGHEYKRFVEVRAPYLGESLDDWWNDEVWPETGDGVLEDIGSYHDAVVVDAADPDLLGRTYGWGS